MNIYETSHNNHPITFAAKSERTRSGFRHVCTIQADCIGCATVKINYYNRTWESYDFEGVMRKAIHAVEWSKDKKEREKIEKKIKKQIDRKAKNHSYKYINI